MAFSSVLDLLCVQVEREGERESDKEREWEKRGDSKGEKEAEWGGESGDRVSVLLSNSLPGCCTCGNSPSPSTDQHTPETPAARHADSVWNGDHRQDDRLQRH